MENQRFLRAGEGAFTERQDLSLEEIKTLVAETKQKK
jgi:hypothetical protein